MSFSFGTLPLVSTTSVFRVNSSVFPLLTSAPIYASLDRRLCQYWIGSATFAFKIRPFHLNPPPDRSTVNCPVPPLTPFDLCSTGHLSPVGSESSPKRVRLCSWVLTVYETIKFCSSFLPKNIRQRATHTTMFRISKKFVMRPVCFV